MVLRVLISIRGQQQQNHFSTVTPTQGRGWAVNWMGSVVRSKGILSEWVSLSGFRCRDSNNNNSKQETLWGLLTFDFYPSDYFMAYLCRAIIISVRQPSIPTRSPINTHPPGSPIGNQYTNLTTWSTFQMMLMMITPTSSSCLLLVVLWGGIPINIRISTSKDTRRGDRKVVNFWHSNFN